MMRAGKATIRPRPEFGARPASVDSSSLQHNALTGINPTNSGNPRHACLVFEELCRSCSARRPSRPGDLSGPQFSKRTSTMAARSDSVPKNQVAVVATARSTGELKPSTIRNCRSPKQIQNGIISKPLEKPE
jgi:hypothetical protein